MPRGRPAVQIALVLLTLTGLASAESTAPSSRAARYLEVSLSGRATRKPDQPSSFRGYRFTLGDLEAGALAGALHLEFPPSVGRPVGSLRATARAHLSWNYAYALLVLTQGGSQERYCALDSAGHQLWLRDFDGLLSPRISDLGSSVILTPESYPLERLLDEMGLDSLPPAPPRQSAMAGSLYGSSPDVTSERSRILTEARQRDSLCVRMLGPDGRERGVWKRGRGDFPFSVDLTSSETGAWEFLPGSNRLVMLDRPLKLQERAPAAGQRLLLSLDDSGRLLWKQDLADQPDQWLLFARDGSLIVTFGSRGLPAARGRRIEERYLCSLHAFSPDGRILGQYQLENGFGLESLLIASKEGLVYFLTDSLRALDTQTGRVISKPPRAPLERLKRSALDWEARLAEGFLSQLVFEEAGRAPEFKLWQPTAEPDALARFEPEGSGVDSAAFAIARSYLDLGNPGHVPSARAQPGSLAEYDYRLPEATTGALAGVLAMEWPARDPSVLSFHDGPPPGWVHKSWNNAYSLLVLAQLGFENSKGLYRCCALDSLGVPLWSLVADQVQGPRISDQGITALFTLTGDETGSKEESLQVRFLDSQGHDLGRWTRAFIRAWRPGSTPYGKFEFLPQSDKLVMLSHCAYDPAGQDPAARQVVLAIDSAGRLLWEVDLSGAVDDRLLFSSDGSLIITYGRQRAHLGADQGSIELYRNSIHVLAADGGLLGYFELEAMDYLEDLLIAADVGLVYFSLSGLRALDLESGDVMSNPPLDPLYRLLDSSRAWESALAERLLAVYSSRRALDPRRR